MLAPAWPLKDRADQLADPDPRLSKVGIPEIVARYQAIIGRQLEAPILIGHSFGGLIVQLLLDQGRSGRHRHQLGAGAGSVRAGPLAAEGREEVTGAVRHSVGLARYTAACGAGCGREGSAIGAGNRSAACSREPQDFLAVINAYGGGGFFAKRGGLRCCWWGGEGPVPTGRNAAAQLGILTRRWRRGPISFCFRNSRTSVSPNRIRSFGGVLPSLGGGSPCGKRVKAKWKCTFVCKVEWVLLPEAGAG